MAMAYFANAVNDTITVNINNALSGTELTPRPVLNPNDAKSLCMEVAPFVIKPNKGKRVFGIDSVNRVTIQFATFRDDPNQFDVTTTNLSGQNLYFYVFENTLVGQNEQGSSLGIKIEMLQVVLKPIQGAGAA
jgi:hypothetical protein